MAKHKAPTVDEMIGQYEAGREQAEHVLSLPEMIRDEVAAGRGTGSPLADMVILRSGIYVPEVASRYASLEERIADNVGKLALVVVRTRADNKRVDEYSTRWFPGKPRHDFYAGVISAEEPEINTKKGKWKIPTERHARTMTCWPPDLGIKPRAEKGSIVVDDFMHDPAVAGHSSTLGEARVSQEREGTLSHPADRLAKTQYRVIQKTTVYIGNKAVGRSKHAETAETLQELLES